MRMAEIKNGRRIIHPAAVTIIYIYAYLAAVTVSHQREEG